MLYNIEIILIKLMVDERIMIINSIIIKYIIYIVYLSYIDVEIK